MAQKFFLYLYCENITEMRRFYGELLGLSESFYAPDKALAYDINGLQFTIFQTDSLPAKSDAWALQPGWPGGRVNSTSWSIQLSEEAFTGAVERIQSTATECYYPSPRWNGYWSFPVKDPQGNTVELSHVPRDEPETLIWPQGQRSLNSNEHK